MHLLTVFYLIQPSSKQIICFDFGKQNSVLPIALYIPWHNHSLKMSKCCNIGRYKMKILSQARIYEAMLILTKEKLFGCPRITGSKFTNLLSKILKFSQSRNGRWWTIESKHTVYAYWTQTTRAKYEDYNEAMAGLMFHNCKICYNDIRTLTRTWELNKCKTATDNRQKQWQL